jgi:hypothetical protein
LRQVLVIAAGGAVGAVLRFWVSMAVHAWLGRGFPYGTLAVNVLGSLAMGFLFVVLIERAVLGAEWRAFLLVRSRRRICRTNATRAPRRSAAPRPRARTSSRCSTRSRPWVIASRPPSEALAGAGDAARPALGLPNLPHASVPDGRDEDDNREERRWGEPRGARFRAARPRRSRRGLGMLDFDAAAKLTGARFTVMTRAARPAAPRAGAVHARPAHAEHGYTEAYVPYLVNPDSLFGTGQLPKFADDLFAAADRGPATYLIPTAEVPLTNLVRGRSSTPRAAAALRRAHAVFPLRGRRLRQGHPRHDPPAPVRQGRAGAHRPPGDSSRGRSRN